MTASQAGRRVTGEREAIEAAIADTTLLTAFAETAGELTGSRPRGCQVRTASA